MRWEVVRRLSTQSRGVVQAKAKSATQRAAHSMTRLDAAYTTPKRICPKGFVPGGKCAIPVHLQWAQKGYTGAACNLPAMAHRIAGKALTSRRPSIPGSPIDL